MLDLEAGIGLDEDEGRVRRRAGGVHQELEGPQARVPDTAGEPEGSVEDPLAQVRIETRGRGDLHHLLEPALDAALALAKVGHVAGPVAQDLDLDVPRPGQEGLDIDIRNPKGGLGLRAATGVGGIQFVHPGDHTGAPAAAAGQGLDDHGLALGQSVQEVPGLLQGDAAVQSAADGHARRQRRFPGPGLVAEQCEVLDGRADEGQACSGTALGEFGPFGEEAVARVDRVASAVEGGLNDCVHVEVGRGPLAGQGMGRVGHPPVQAVGVVLGPDRHRAASQVRCCAGDADGDFAAVGDQDGRYRHGCFLRPSSGL